MKIKIFSGIFALLALGLYGRVSAQETVRVWASFDTVGLIGDALRLTLNCESDRPENVNFPILQDKLSDDLQIIPEDSLRTSVSPGPNARLSVRSITYLFSAYTEGSYTMPSFRFEYLRNDSIVALHTDSGMIRFFAPVVDTTQSIKDIRTIFDVDGKELWKEYFARYGYWLWIVIGVAVLTLLILYIWQKKRHAKPLFVPRKAPVPAVDKALKAMAELKEKQLWQQNRVKEYYTELTDILRVYIAADMHIAAIEMTNEELRAALSEQWTGYSGDLSDLLSVLDMSVLVKFAKVQPLPSDHETCFEKVLDFLKKKKQEQVSVKTEKTLPATENTTGTPTENRINTEDEPGLK